MSPRFIPHMDDVDGCPTDYMHTSLQGTVPQEGYQHQFYNIRIKGWYSRLELNAACRNAKLPPGHHIPEFGKYVEEGIGTRSNPLPSQSAKLKFSASQSRYWLEHGTQIMLSIFEKKGNVSYKTDAAWKSWLALVEVETAALAQRFIVPDDLIRLDELQLKHHTLYLKVKQYADSDKPKRMMRANYPVDIENTGTIQPLTTHLEPWG